MTAVNTHVRGDFKGDFIGLDGVPHRVIGWASLAHARVTTPVVRVHPTDSALILPDPYPGEGNRVFRNDNPRAMRVSTATDVQIINLVWPFHAVLATDWSADHPPLPYYAEIEMGGLTGYEARFNGLHLVGHGYRRHKPPIPGIRPGFTRAPAYVPLFPARPHLRFSFGPDLDWLPSPANGIPRWQVRIRVGLLPWTKNGPIDDIEGTYIPNPGTYPGTTCRVRWAGATWL